MTPTDASPSAPAEPRPLDTAAILERDARHRSGLWSPDVAFVRGDDVRLYDADGNAYLDLMAGIAVASVGHANPRLADAISEQARRLIACPQNLANDVRADLQDLLLEMAGPPLERVFLSNSGTEANEAALKWARVATGRARFVAAKRGFSGRTLGSLSTTWEKAYREPFEPMRFETEFVRYGDLDELDAAVDDGVAAILLEPVQGEGGVHPATSEYLLGAMRVARERGALLILDEIQTGAGRSGRFLAFQRTEGLEPDIVTMAKGLGGGVPIGATLMTAEVAAAMPKGGHGTTFGGNPLSAAAARAVLLELRERDLIGNAERVGAYLRGRIEALGSERVREVRGVGLMIGVELKGKAAPVLAALRERGVLAINAGATVIRFVPPLTFTEAHADEAVAALAGALEATAGDAAGDA